MLFPALAVAFQSSPAIAASSTGNLAISAIVTAQCVIQSAALPFGTYNSAAVQQSAQIGVTCSNGTSYTVSLDAGAGTGANTTTRKLATSDNSSTLNYALYQDPARSKSWGNSSGSDTLTSTGNGTLQSLPVYGYIPAGQTSKPGAYADVVSITLAY
ncbi:spore coat U domain-containing protein [Herbaspirillum lusitanum]|uniref:Spore coat U domain-containing protein n=2 Tax=Herbaspirillum lusitanum TaxID=213312 RepID=A0ABW9AC73_9BURK